MLADRFARAIAAAFGDEHREVDPLIQPSGNAKFGDYQANVAMSLAKRVGRKPRDVAQAILDRVDLDGICERTEIAGPGFINLHLTAAFLGEQLCAAATDARLGVPRSASPRTVVVDYSGPNVAKEMHVGHLRSAIIGDAIVRVLDFQGHRVIRQNHLGDWGTQFGMLIEHLIDIGFDPQGKHAISDLNTLYQEAKRKDDSDAQFAARARQRVVKLQAGDEQTLTLWRALIDESKRHFNVVYRRLGLLLTDQDIRPESFYNDHLPEVIESLADAGLLKESQGAAVVYPPGFKDRDGNPMPMIVRKSDGGYLYATTDLAALRYRASQLGAQRIIYVTDARQAQHFAMVFAAVRAAGWVDQTVQLEHVAFGTVLGSDNRPFKTREGGTVRLVDLLDEAQQRAAAVVDEKAGELPADERAQVAKVIGIAALKYADLSSDRVKDYIFDWQRMLSMDGNTAPYLINAYVRIASIFRKAADAGAAGDGAAQAINIVEPEERQLALRLLQFPGVVDAVATHLEPHRLCTYLYDTAAMFHSFYEKCRVLGGDDAVQRSRLALCRLTGDVLKQGMTLLGIDTVERM